MLPAAQHAFEIDLARVEAVVELGDTPRVGRKKARDVLEAVHDLVREPRTDPVALIAADADRPADEVRAVGEVLSAAGWRVLLLVDDPEPGPPPLGVLRWETLDLDGATDTGALVARVDEAHGAGRACVRVEGGAAPHVGAGSTARVPRRGVVPVLEVRFGGTVADTWFSMGGGTCERGLNRRAPDPAKIALDQIYGSLGELSACRLDGSIQFEVVATIDGGRVVEVFLDGPDERAAPCVEARIRAWAFPERLGRVTVRFSTGA